MSRCLTRLVFVLAALPAATLHAQQETSSDSAPPPLYKNLGQLHRAIRTTSPKAQKYFDQGLRLTYAFNHAEAIRSFQYATELDSTCAMCWWGIANALGPNINLPMDPSAIAPAYAASERAQALIRHTTPADQALIQAQAVRFTADTAADRGHLDSAYATKLRDARRHFPGDPDIAALFAESMLDLRPWNQWKRDGTPQPGTLEIVAVLERAIARNPNHVGLCHFYIHTVEGSSKPERALPCAKRLPGLMPGAGHIVHMPAHIAIRLGDYAQAIEHNRHATHVDRAYLDGPHTNSIYGVAYNTHNWHFLSVAAAYAGRSHLAIDAAEHTRQLVPLDLARQISPLEYWLPIPYFALVRFEKWDEMLAEPAPPPDLRYTTAMWRFGHGMASIGKGDLKGAAEDGDTIAAILAATPKEAIVGVQPSTAMIGMVGQILAGALARAHGDDDGALKHFEHAVVYQERLTYDEPPPDYISPRQLLGAELLRQGKAKEAEAVFRADLEDHRENGWSLLGLSRALKAEKQLRAAKVVEARYKRAWKGADYQVGYEGK